MSGKEEGVSGLPSENWSLSRLGDEAGGVAGPGLGGSGVKSVPHGTELPMLR